MPNLNPKEDLIRAQVLRGSSFSTSSVAKSAPEHRPTRVALAARTISSGTNTQ